MDNKKQIVFLRKNKMHPTTNWQHLTRLQFLEEKKIFRERKKHTVIHSEERESVMET